MGKTESTAVTAFINSVRQDMDGAYLKPSLGTNHPGVETTRPALPKPRVAPTGTPAPSWSTPPLARARGTAPPPMPAAPPPMPAAPPPMPAEARPTAERPAVRAPSQLIIPPHLQESATTRTPKVEIDPADSEWFDSGEESEVSALEAIAIDWEEFGDVEITDEDLSPPKKRSLVLPLLGAGVLVAGIGVAAFLGLRGGGDDTKLAAATAGEGQTHATTAAETPQAAATAIAATPAEPAPAPAVAEPIAAPAEAMPVTGGVVLRPANFTSDPPGAAVTLVMNGKPVPLGPAPVDAQLDPSKSYEVVFTMPGHNTVLRAVSFDGTGEIAIGASMQTADAEPAVAAVDEAAPVAEEPEPAAEEPAPAVTERKVRKRSRKATSRRAAKRATRRSARTSKKKTAAVTMRGDQGILMINAKPPCDVYVDGRKRGKTPQRSLALPAGKHKVKLVNRSYKINKTFAVKITKGKKTKVIKDLTDRMR